MPASESCCRRRRCASGSRASRRLFDLQLVPLTGTALWLCWVPISHWSGQPVESLEEEVDGVHAKGGEEEHHREDSARGEGREEHRRGGQGVSTYLVRLYALHTKAEIVSAWP
jgi:hypothetical protein